MFRLSAHQNGDTFDIWLFDDHAEDHGGDHNLTQFWEDLLEGASVVNVEASAVARDENGNITQQGPWVSFTVNLARWGAKKNLRANIANVTRDQEYLVRFSIDGGPWLGPISFRWSA